MRVCVVAEFYPRAADPVLGVWPHRQALPAPDAAPEARVVSVPGGDVLSTGGGSPAGRARVAAAFAAARAVLANSADPERRCRELGARATRVVHLGTDFPERIEPDHAPPTLVTVGHLV